MTMCVSFQLEFNCVAENARLHIGIFRCTNFNSLHLWLVSKSTAYIHALKWNQIVIEREKHGDSGVDERVGSIMRIGMMSGITLKV